jgi:predicted RNA-binding Zn-ribbon protein involved in translation (DUF1610 family)
VATEPQPLPPLPADPAPEVSALDKHHCPGCGAEAEWNAAKQALVCPYCGTVTPMTVAADGSLLEAHDAGRVLRAITDEARGWATGRRPVRCTTCQAISLFESERVAGRCEFCGATTVLPLDTPSRPIRPAGVLPFALTETEARDRVRAAVGRQASVLSARGLYVPYWRLTVDVYVHWSALVDEGTEKNPSYQPADGGFSDIQDDWLVPATRGVPEELTRHLGSFPLEQLRPYAAEFLRGWVVEQYQLDLVGASERVCAQAVANAPAKYRRACHNEVPARRYSALSIAATSSVKAFTHLLLPIWLVQVASPNGASTLLVNGATGTVSGAPAAASRWGRVVTAVVVLGVIAWILWRVL